MRRNLSALAATLVLLAGCTGEDSTTTSAPEATTIVSDPGGPLYLNSDADAGERAADLLSRMTIEEKIGQMTLIERNSLTVGQIKDLMLGGVLSGGGAYPLTNTVEGWRRMIGDYQLEATSTRLGIPLFYGVDSVHGHGLLLGATLFPHQIGLGAAGDPDLVRRIAVATAEETLATGATWNYAPVVGVLQDIRWGRTYETFGSDPDLVTLLSGAAVEGYESTGLVSTPKHYLADAAAEYGTGTADSRLVDRGDVSVGMETLRSVHLPPYQSAIQAGARSVMLSFTSVDGQRMHSHSELVNGVLKGELGFEGFVVSDWQAIDSIFPNDFEESVEAAINAGVDMVMVPYDGPRFVTTMMSLYETGRISIDRIDDAVRRILTVKFSMGLFEEPVPGSDLAGAVGSVDHIDLADEAVAASAVKLVNDGTLPLADPGRIFVSGAGANDTGIQAGGWSIEWQGVGAGVIPGTTVVEALEDRFGSESVVWAEDGVFTGWASVGIAVVAERPYTEWFGDSSNLRLPAADLAAMNALAERVDRLVVVVIAGRPVDLDPVLGVADAVVMAWLPGSEASGLVAVLGGEVPFTGRLPVAWPRDVSQLPFVTGDTRTGCDGPLFPIGFGADDADTLVLQTCS